MVILHVELRGLINEADALETIKKREAEEAAMDFHVAVMLKLRR